MAYRALSPLLLFGLLEILSWGVYSVSTLFLLLHIGEGVIEGEAASCLPNESLALLQFKQSLSPMFATSQPLLSTWKNESDCCEWEGISCDHSTGFVTGLNIWGRDHTPGTVTISASWGGDSPGFKAQVSDPNSSLFELSHLQSLDLSYTLVIGLNLSRLSELTDLTGIWLSHCNLSGPIPESFKQLSSLTYLDLSRNGLSGEIPPSLLNHTTLQALDLSKNKLYGSLPDPIPESFKQLSNLTYLDLSDNGLSGEIPPSLLNHTTLQVLDLSKNKLYGSLPDPIPESFKQLSSLTNLDLSYNSLSGEIPPGIVKHPHLQTLYLHNNKLNGSFPDVGNEFSPLVDVDLSYNMLDGEIPPSIIRKLPHLEGLHIQWNRFTGTMDFSLFQNLSSLSFLDISWNNLTVQFPKTVHVNHQTTIFPHLETLHLMSCNIKGKVPTWVWRLPEIQSLDLSHNKLDGFEEAVNINVLRNLSSSKEYGLQLYVSNNNMGTIPSALFCNMLHLHTLDISGNNLTGTIPNCLTNLTLLNELDLSKNQLQGQIPRGLICHSEYVLQVALSDNQLTGEITRLLFNCSQNNVMILDLSNNKLIGSLPDDLFTNFYQLTVLDLSNNQLHGPIPEEFSSTPHLEMFNLNDNKLVGRIPRFPSKGSELEVINLGNNELSDVFPFWLGHLDNLRVLVLHSNKLHGTISSPFPMHLFSSLLILDISGNQLKGHLPSGLFQNFSSMRTKQENVDSHDLTYISSTIYQEELVLTIKGQSQVWRMITILTSIDLSNNLFTGGIPEDIGALKELISLNLSRNNLDGPIPRLFGQLQSMESLDLSHNHLSGSIPEELIHDTFLSTLDLSYNNLQGRIPQGNQFDTFNATSFDGNPGLCGPPLPISCPSTNGGPQVSINHVKEMARDLHWEYLAAGIGYALGFLTTILPILFIQKVGRFCVHVDRAFEACINIPTLSWIFYGA